MRLLLAIGVALAALGCDSKYEPKRYTCESDGDCVVSCAIPDSCCGAGCQCDRPYHEDELAAIRAHNERRCAGKEPDCPHYVCPEPTTRILPVCRDGRCATVEVERRPRGDSPAP